MAAGPCYLDDEVLKKMLTNALRRNAPRGMEESFRIQNDAFNYIVAVLELRARQLIRKATEITPRAPEGAPLVEDCTFGTDAERHYLARIRAVVASDVIFSGERERALDLAHSEVFYQIARSCGALTEDCVADLESKAGVLKKSFQTAAAVHLWNNLLEMVEKLPYSRTSTVTAYDMMKVFATEGGLRSGPTSTTTKFRHGLINGPRERRPAPAFYPTYEIQSDYIEQELDY